MTEKREDLVRVFKKKCNDYLSSFEGTRSEASFIGRVFHNIQVYGPSYLFLQLCRFRVRGLFWNTTIRLFNGKTMILPVSDIGTHIFGMHGILPHRSERKLTFWFLRNLTPNDIFYDIGAHLGFYTALASEMIRSGSVHSFEPNEKLCKYLEKNFSDTKNVYINCTAVSSEAGMIDFYDLTNILDSSVNSRFNMTGQKITPKRVPAVSIDQYVRDGNKPPSVMKIDVEGGEYDILCGGKRTIQQYKPQIIMEILSESGSQERTRKAVDTLLEFGYRAFFIRNEGFVESKETHDPVQRVMDLGGNERANVLFIPKT